jgi:hypothetical protein
MSVAGVEGQCFSNPMLANKISAILTMRSGHRRVRTRVPALVDPPALGVERSAHAHPSLMVTLGRRCGSPAVDAGRGARVATENGTADVALHAVAACLAAARSDAIASAPAIGRARPMRPTFTPPMVWQRAPRYQCCPRIQAREFS